MTNILTLRLDEVSQTQFEALRQRHFPPEKNKVPAHLSLFHTLPDVPQVEEVLLREARPQSQILMTVTGVRSLGRGVAYALSSSDLSRLHARLSDSFAELLTAQDRQRFQPHIVVQNKVEPAVARELQVALQAEFVRMEVSGVGLDLWHYLGGPWELARTFWFAPSLLSDRGSGGGPGVADQVGETDSAEGISEE